MNNIFSINIICLGNWNKKIFSPTWVASNLFELKENKIEAFFNPSELDIGFKLNDVVLFPKDASVEIKLDKISDDAIELSGKLLNKILSILPHTPIKAIGINIRYKFNKDENNDLVSKLNTVKCKIDEFETNQVKFTKKFEKFQLNLIADINPKDYLVNFNFHYDYSLYPDGFTFSDKIVFDNIETTKELIKND